MRAQVAVLREELERLRTERETQALFELPLEPPPRYEGRRGLRGRGLTNYMK